MNSTEPLGLPRGSVRAIVTLLLLGACLVLLFVPAVDGSVQGMVLLLTGIAVRDYFATRRTQDIEAGPPQPPSFVRDD